VTVFLKPSRGPANGKEESFFIRGWEKKKLEVSSRGLSVEEGKGIRYKYGMREDSRGERTQRFLKGGSKPVQRFKGRKRGD